MARTVRRVEAGEPDSRAALKPASKPYWRALDEGLHVGYRKGQGAGKWVVRRYAGDRSACVETIGAADDTLDPDGAIILSYSQAQGEARKRFTAAKRSAASYRSPGRPLHRARCHQ